MRISYWSSDVCSSDLAIVNGHRGHADVSTRGSGREALGSTFPGRAGRSGCNGGDSGHRRLLSDRSRSQPKARPSAPLPSRDVAGEPGIRLYAELAPVRYRGLAGLSRLGLLSRHRHGRRSEEHTSELQSLMRISYAVFCLKKKKTNKIK